MQVHGKSPHHADYECQTLRLHRLSCFVGFQALQASTRVDVHTRRLTPTQAQETEPEEGHSDESDLGRTAKGKKKEAGGGADTGEEKQTRSRHTRRGPTPAEAPPRKG